MKQPWYNIRRTEIFGRVEIVMHLDFICFLPALDLSIRPATEFEEDPAYQIFFSWMIFTVNYRFWKLDPLPIPEWAGLKQRRSL